MSIWNYRKIKNFIDTQDLLTLKEGQTPIDKFSIKNTTVFLKREDANPTGSWKDRGMAYVVTNLKKQGITSVVISSSGNAAVSLLEYAKLYPKLSVHIIVSPKNITDDKKQKIETLIQNTNHTLNFDEKPKRKRAELVVSKDAFLISSAHDDNFVRGYWSLGFELAKTINNLQKIIPIFVQASSGAGLVGLVQGIMMNITTEKWTPQIFVCQTTQTHPVVSKLYNQIQVVTEKSMASAISDKSMLRSPQILKVIEETNGDAFAISNDELQKAREVLPQKIASSISNTSLLSIAGLLRAKETIQIEHAICIASGL